MRGTTKFKNKLVRHIILLLVVVIGCFLIFGVLVSRNSFSSDTETRWDGVSVASSFSLGNGTLENPYVISNGEEFAYFKRVIEEENSIYADKAYILGDDINLDNHEFNTIGGVFKGHFDGNGYTIKNIKNIMGSLIGDYNYYGLFGIVESGYITNLNIDNLIVSPNGGEGLYKIGSFASLINSGTINNISISNSSIDLGNLEENKDNIIGGFSAYIGDCIVNRIYIDVDIKSKFITGIGKISNSIMCDTNLIINDVTSNKDVSDYIVNQNIMNNYITSNDKEFFNGDEVIGNDNLLILLNTDIDNNYIWYFDNTFKIKMMDSDSSREEVIGTFQFSINNPIVLHDTSIEGDTVYINDLDSDYNYYIGLNYTDFSNTGTLPTGISNNTYNDSNLVKVYTKYLGSDIRNSDLIGYVSLEEQYSNFVYYKYYPVIDGYVTFELIDNPYADRVDNMVFNGWYTDYDGAEVYLDKDTYVWYVKIPVNNVSDIISITFNASWIKGKVSQITSNDVVWNNVLAPLDEFGFWEIKPIPIYEEVNDLYVMNTIGRWGTYPDGAVNLSGGSVAGGWCTDRNGCTYYVPIDSGNIDPDTTYYRLVNNRMTAYNPVIIGYEGNDMLSTGDLLVGFYEAVTIPRGGSLSGYYSSDVVYNFSGTCNDSGGCTMYKRLPYYDEDGNELTYDGTSTYYYLATRDTNIVVLSGNITASLNDNQKPFTLTSVHNGIDYRSSASYNIRNSYIRIGSDLRIEYINLTTNRRASSSSDGIATSTNSSGYIYGNWHNLKLGRGLVMSNSVSASGVLGGGNDSTGSVDNLTRYRLIIESGYYNVLAVTNGSVNSGWWSSVSDYIDGYGVYGNDLDRINGDNSKLNIYFCASGSWGGDIYSSNQTTGVAITTVIKSGSFGSSKADYSTGVYVGGRSGGTHYAARRAIVEGGYVYNLIGGPLTGDGRTNINDTYINIKGGSVDFVIGGAGASATNGNRIISHTDGIVNYSIFGGSNGYSGSDTGSYLGTLEGSTFVYVGGNAVVGDDNLVSNNSSVFGAEAGSVFGIGNGNSASSKIGTANNSNVVIDGNAVIKRNVYGGGNYGSVGINASSSSSSIIQILNGRINGSVYGGGNNNGAGSTSVKANINITMQNGTVNGSIYGGSKTKGIVYGDSSVSVLGGTVNNDVYGGGEGGYTDSTNYGTFVTDNVSLVIGDNVNTQDLNINGNVYGGSAFGSVNGDSNTTAFNSNLTTNVLVNRGVITGSVFGGGKGNSSFTPNVFGSVVVNVNGGNIGNVFGGNDNSGSPSGSDIVYLNGGIIGNCYGGGNNTGQKETNIYLQGSEVNNLFGGSNSSGTVDISHVTITSGVVGANVYGGNNIGGTTITTNVLASSGTFNGDIYGGGSLADSTTSNVDIQNISANNVYGGGEKASVDTTNVLVTLATLDSVYGGSNVSGDVKRSNVSINSGTINNVYGSNNQGGVTNTTLINIHNGKISNVFGGGNNALAGDSTVNVYDGWITNVYGGGNEAGLTTANVNISGGGLGSVFGGSNTLGDVANANVSVVSGSDVTIDNVYGGNNMGGATKTSVVDINAGNILNVYGGGNEARCGGSSVNIDDSAIGTVYGGGNAAEVSTNTFVDINNSNISGGVYGGGNEGVVLGNTEVFLTNAKVLGSCYAGGNGSTAVVSLNTSITIDGNSIIGSSDGAVPFTGSVFGSGNAASTGSADDNNSVATVNIVGATIYGNVYGGANTSVVYGKTITNIGTMAVSANNLVEGDIVIKGTIFGGGEANASGSENYDFKFISVTDAINIYIDGNGYVTNGNKFLIEGSVFGSGNASSSSGTSDILIKNLGLRSAPSKNISIQRADTVVLDNCVIELSGTTDRTNEYSTIKYSFNRIDSLTIKNNTVLLLKQNANLLKNFNSMVDIDGVEKAALVTIDKENRTVTKNVDNRLYLLAGRNLNITTNEAATAYGKVTGMAFFGMYNTYESGTFQYGIYGDDVSFGSDVDASDMIIGGSYVLGLHHANHDITTDGFYTNYMADDYSDVTTDYIEPTPPDAGYYMWTIGIKAINYTIDLSASKYSSLGTTQLSLLDFSKGNTTFDLIGFNTEGLKNGVSLVDNNSVPNIAATPEDANKVLGLVMRAETREWSSHGATKFYTSSSNKYTGDVSYVTDNQQVAPSLMFYLYHAKNIALNEEIGSVVITLQARVPKNEIESDVELITITINISSINFNDEDAYDASITYNKRYEMPSSTTVNITNKSQFTTYYSLFAESETFEKFYGNDNSNYHTLVTNNPLPVGTQITMIDIGNGENNPKYYYYNVTEDNYNVSLSKLSSLGEVTYPIRDFIKMGSTDSNNKFDEKKANLSYYSNDSKYVMEEFIFIFDFKETNVTGTHLNNTMLFELRNYEDRSLINVLGIRYNLMVYNTYDNSNVVLNEDVNIDNNYLYYDISNSLDLATNILYDFTGNSDAIVDTNYEANSMGLNVEVIDSSNNKVSSSMLTGTNIMIDNVRYFADGDGVFRIKLAGKVANLNKKLFITTDRMLPSGVYTLRFTLFASSDGMHNSHLLESSSVDIVVSVVGSDNSIVVEADDTAKLIYGDTGKNAGGFSYNLYTVSTNSVLSRPNFRISLFKRSIDNKDSTSYEEIPIDSLFINNLTDASSMYETIYNYEKILNVSANGKTNLRFDFVPLDQLISGTYKLTFKIYDNNQLIEEEDKYIIVRKEA